ncbi:Response regulator receiver domain-containing protein [Loktanella atrilutea]|uniref:Response regulator receiver domain-containing protein n=1 Tax=Loktanella atrilutea TaxID=366533 RepID=A0A1M5EX55_LOKAT|nr:response regulator [Loktanella atrilutea]SHF83850.1 Response regulator receiver domain-containing protein [Loktanella atrilutea]
MKILVVDDDPFILQLINLTLASAGYADVTFLEDAGQAAPVILRATPAFDCMLIDMRMPGVTGEALCSWVRTLPEHKDTPILMVTALSEKADIDVAFAAGASDYITKPIVASDFIARIDQVRRQMEKRDLLKSKQGGTEPAPGRIDFYQPRWLGGIEGEIEIDALEKYIFQLSKSGSLRLEAFSFAIKDASKLHRSCTPDDFMFILQSVGMAISRCLQAPQFFLSYAGYGAFTGIAQKAEGHAPSWRDTETDVQGKLENLQLPSSGDSPVSVVPYMSPPQTLGASNGQRAVDVLYRVIGDAEDRCGGSLLSL